MVESVRHVRRLYSLYGVLSLCHNWIRGLVQKLGFYSIFIHVCYRKVCEMKKNHTKQNASALWITILIVGALVVLASTSVYFAKMGGSAYVGTQAAGSRFVPSTTVATNQTTYQSLKLQTGWNIISLNVSPDSYEPDAVFKPLIDSGTLVLVKDELGKIFWPEYQINQIGSLKLGEGYEVHVMEDVELRVPGVRLPLPIQIGLGAGWNIMAYPSGVSANALKVLEPLLKNNSLVEVRDAAGRRIYRQGRRWVNQIGSFTPGQGYRIYMTAASTLEIVR